MKTIILDTDFILSSIKYKLDIQEKLRDLCNFNFRISYIDQTLNELKNKPNEKLAKKIISKFNKIKTSKNKPVDNLILELTKNNISLIIATQDKELKEKLKKGKTTIITIRQKKYLVFMRP